MAHGKMNREAIQKAIGIQVGKTFERDIPSLFLPS
jgi:hypothetical protein